MLTTVPIEELASGDRLNTGDPATAAEEALPEEIRNARLMVRDAMAVPYSMPELFARASTVRKFHKAGTIYTHVVMDSGAVVRLRKGSPVSVYRKGPNGPQDVSPAVLDTVPAETEEVPYGPERQPFNYARSQFRQLGNYRAKGIYASKLKVVSDGGETHWMNVHPDDLAALQRLMEAREDNS